MSQRGFCPQDMRKDVTENLETVYRFIGDYIDSHRRSPSIREIAEATYFGRSTVMRYLERLELKGRIHRTPGQARSIQLISIDHAE